MLTSKVRQTAKTGGAARFKVQKKRKIDTSVLQDGNKESETRQFVRSDKMTHQSVGAFFSGGGQSALKRRPAASPKAVRGGVG